MPLRTPDSACGGFEVLVSSNPGAPKQNPRDCLVVVSCSSCSVSYFETPTKNRGTILCP